MGNRLSLFSPWAPVLGLVAIVSPGCSFPPAGAEFHRAAYTSRVPKMVDSQDKILAVGCAMTRVSWNPFTVVGRCDMSLSTAASDLLNNIHTNINAVNAATGGAADSIRDAIINAATSHCRIGVDSALQTLVERQTNPTLKALLQNQIATNIKTAGWCWYSAMALWYATADPQYATGRTCAAFSVEATFVTPDGPASFAVSPFPIPEYTPALPGCPRERMTSGSGRSWGSRL